MENEVKNEESVKFTLPQTMFALNPRISKSHVNDVDKRLSIWHRAIANSIRECLTDSVEIRKNRLHQVARLHRKLVNLVIEYQTLSLDELRSKLLAIDTVSRLVYREGHSLAQTIPYLEIDFRELSPGEVVDQIFKILPSRY